MLCNREAIFLADLEDITLVDPAQTRLVDDQSPRYRNARLYIESYLRRRVPTDATLHVGHKAAMDTLSYQLEPAALLASGNMGFDIDIAIEIAIRSIQNFTPKNSLSEVYLITYGSFATQRMRDAGYAVEEVVDQLYVLEKDEGYKPPAIHAALWAKEGIKPIVEHALAFAEDAMLDPGFHQKLKEETQKTLVAFWGKGLKKGLDKLFG